MTMSIKETVLAVYGETGGNISATARECGLNRATVRKYVNEAGYIKPLHGGRHHHIDPIELGLPEPGEVKRYILTSAQNNTKVHEKFFANLTAYSDWLGASLMVATYAYNKSSYSNAKSVKRGRGPTESDKADLWYDPVLTPYLCDDPDRFGDAHFQLAPDFIWCAKVNILPTAARPLSDLGTYMGARSIAVPHAKLAMLSVPTSRDEMPKFAYTTGTVTRRNYVQKKAGLKAEFHHAYAALLVEVDSNGDWWCRQLNADSKGRFFDFPDIGEKGIVQVEDGEVYSHETGVEAVQWGDVHASEIDEWVRTMNWSKGGILDALRPKYQFMHDLLSFRSQSHHERNRFGTAYKKFVQGIDKVSDEVAETSGLLLEAERGWCTTVVVNSNHDRHGDRWLDEADYRYDKPNARFFLEAQLARVTALDEGRDWEFLTWAMRHVGGHPAVIFLGRDESFTICGDIECGWHGDDGPNGARGTTRSLANTARRVNKGHDHAAAILDGVYSAGACSMTYDYQTGPSAQSVSHIVTYPNGKRTIITARNGKWRA